MGAGVDFGGVFGEPAFGIGYFGLEGGDAFGEGVFGEAAVFVDIVPALEFAAEVCDLSFDDGGFVLGGGEAEVIYIGQVFDDSFDQEFEGGFVAEVGVFGLEG